MSDKTNYTLDELAAESGFEVRTIRSYIERGLLPSAQSRGRNATYLQAHLERLRVIKMRQLDLMHEATAHTAESSSFVIEVGGDEHGEFHDKG